MKIFRPKCKTTVFWSIVFLGVSFSLCGTPAAPILSCGNELVEDGHGVDANGAAEFTAGLSAVPSHVQASLAGRRVVIDGVLDTQECRTLIGLLKRSIDPDMQHYPYDTDFQNHYAGATMFELSEAASESELGLLLLTKQRVLAFVRDYFDVPAPLYFDYVHFTHRFPHQVDGTRGGHGYHADNCLPNPDGSCDKSATNCCAWRDYSAVLYMNGDDDTLPPRTGGEFEFVDDLQGSNPVAVETRCGRLVAFTSGAENIHGVRRVTSGDRYALNMWMSFDSDKCVDCKQDWSR